MASKIRLILFTFCAGLIVGWLSLLSFGMFYGCATNPSVGLRERTVTVSGKPHGGQLYSGYKRLECTSCENSWELENDRAPLGFMVGAQKSGTSWLLKNMDSHPQIYKCPNEPHVFDYQWEKFGDDDTVDRCKIMQHYNELLSHSKHPSTNGLLDKSPFYMVESQIIPQRILCAFPRTKIIITLRNPVDRAFSHYQMMSRRVQKEATQLRPFEDYVETEIGQLESLDLLNPDLTPQEEYEKWSRKPNMANSFVARGLYAIQIRQFLSVLMDHFGSDKAWDHLLILESEQVWKNPEAHWHKVLDFFNVPSFLLGDMRPPPPKRYDQTMANSTRARLDDLYRPHNKKLHELLAPYGIEISWAKAAGEM